MYYGILTPEINSARMYAGAGSGPLMAAAAAWDGLAAELHSAAAAYGSVISGLTNEWSGPSSAAMAAAAAPYVAWMNATATQAQQAAGQAKAAAAAYEEAFAMTVPPPVVAANRSQLMSLTATNVLGQNTPAIAATEAHYGEMWAQDAAAMYGYAASSAAATTFTPFTAPPKSTNQAGQLGQAATVAQVTGTSAATNTQSVLSQVNSAVSPAVQQLALPLQALPGGVGNNSVATFGPNANIWNTITSSGVTNPAVVTSMMADLSAVNAFQNGGFTGLFPGGANGVPGLPGVGALGAKQLIATVRPDLGGAAVSAGLGRATTVGALSVPQSWSAAIPAVNSAATALPGSSFSAIPANGTPGVPGMPMAGMGGRTGGTGPRYGFKPVVMARPPAAGYGPMAV